ncbi:hypothetical protein IWQ57_006742, partial [Coemansia nantahalensis]
MLNVMSEFASEQRITWAPEKCVFLAPQALQLTIGDAQLPQQQSFRYLGVMIGHDGIRYDEHIRMLCARTQKMRAHMASIGITNLAANLNQAMRLYKAFIRPAMEYGLEVCRPNKKRIARLERCQGEMLRAIMGLPKCTSYAAILLLCDLPTMEHRWRTRITHYVHRRERPTTHKHILGGLFDEDRVRSMRSNHIIRQLRDAAYCTGVTTHEVRRVTKAKEAEALAQRTNITSAERRVQHIRARPFIRKLYRQYRTPIIRWLLGAIAVQPATCTSCGERLTRDHAVECAEVLPIIRNTRAYKAKLGSAASVVMTNPIDKALAGLRRGDYVSA